MIHPLLRLVATQPQLLAEHAEAYAGLVGDEVARVSAALKRRLALKLVALCLGAVALVLGGVAVMFWAVLPPASVAVPWALVAAPGVPALVALACLMAARAPAADGFAGLKAQLAADMAMLRKVSAP